MSLLQLPTEILILIFDYVGSYYFRSDLSRLTVSKQWGKFAHTACFQEFFVTQKTLRRLLSSPYMEASLLLLKDSVEVLDLSLKGFADWDSIPLSQLDLQAINVLDVPTWDGPHGRAVCAAWTTELANDLSHLATITKHSRKLRILRIQATSELHPLLPLLERRDYLFISTIRAFLSASNLTSLELDLCGTRLIPCQSQEHVEDFHVCTSIAALLTTLRRLRLRMRNICAEVLKHRPYSTNLHLDEMLINLSLSNESPLNTSAAHATCCGSSPGAFLQLKADMESQAQDLIAQTTAPKIARILTHALPSLEMRAFDVLTGRNLALSEGAEWDADGEVIQDEVSDEESEISDLSSDNE
ncbi:uncharacterized protein K460DRAFT_371824 [Cucurbitaria berberidis CBS 394.84]|uniref:F-box domain-containing protein n=1 Tax=Cucurbitaria berberidis CBS 394.84 TaxID=1168544 RepID=A0A9P4L3Q0_9PLEO|nr:uncharacterized protein K460DRAFT_371824 [Cucurbitaria berberidis CBS 394.84]KAF1840620.1 hypothetical protein K460DRAFT_371824 [Cucurbitaria berberidis CBS 394.84]